MVDPISQIKELEIHANRNLSSSQNPKGFNIKIGDLSKEWYFEGNIVLPTALSGQNLLA